MSRCRGAPPDAGEGDRSGRRALDAVPGSANHDLARVPRHRPDDRDNRRMIGVLSLCLAVIGLFGLTAYAVKQRTREFGVRMALGARAKDVVQLVAGQSMRLVALGAVIGVAASLAGAGVLRNMLFGVRAVDPLAYGGVGILLAVGALLACYIPARRATRVDP